MRTNENKKRKNQPDNGAGSTSGCGMIVFILPAMPAHSHAIKICQHSPASSASVHADAIPRFASPPHSRRVPPMPAFSAFPPRSHSSPPLTAAAAPPTHTRGVHMYTCVQRVSLLSVVWRIPPPWDHVYIVFNRASMSRRRRRRRGV